MSSRALCAAVLALLPACDAVFGLERHPAASDAPQPPDGPGIDAQMCFGTGALTLCLVTPAGPPLIAGPGVTTTINTDNPAACAKYVGGEPALCVVTAERIEVEGRLRAVGALPIVLVTPTTITVGESGVFDLSGDPADTAAGSQPAECIDGSDAMMSGGGAGGSFARRGGNGGSGNGGSGGTASAAAAAVRLRGGCKGKVGANAGGASGRGGGALALFAGVRIDVQGTINASGARGQGGPGNASPGRGAGGGGSGGMIVLDAPLVEIGPAGQIFANGGGGGEGGGNPAAGNHGSAPASWNVAAAGGAGGSVGGDGGDGSVGTTAGQTANGSASTEGGGGGGGGAGAIRIVTPAPPVDRISPPPS